MVLSIINHPFRGTPMNGTPIFDSRPAIKNCRPHPVDIEARRDPLRWPRYSARSGASDWTSASDPDPASRLMGKTTGLLTKNGSHHLSISVSIFLLAQFFDLITKIFRRFRKAKLVHIFRVNSMIFAQLSP